MGFDPRTLARSPVFKTGALNLLGHLILVAPCQSAFAEALKKAFLAQA